MLRILANQAAVSLHTSEQYQAGLALHRRAQRLYDEATAQARDLADRTAELRQVEERLLLAHQRELIDAERHRIARELHDSVTQYVLSAGMAVEIARGEAEALGRPAPRSSSGCTTAKELSQDAVEQLRSGDLRAAPAAPRHRLDAARAAARGRPPAQAGPVGRRCASRATSVRAARRRRARDRPHRRARRCSTWPCTRRRAGRSCGCATGRTGSRSAVADDGGGDPRS